MKTIGMYCELDPYSSLIPRNINGFQILISDLKKACLLYDQVLTNSNALIDNPLTLPAFEHMEPFVRSGLLWTSGASQNSPHDFIQKRLESSLGNTETLDADFESASLRWKAITPQHWNVKRNSAVQMEGATNIILEAIDSQVDKKSISSRSFDSILRTIEYMNQDKIFDRDLVLAKMGFLKHDMSQKNFHNLIMITQSAFLKQGTINKNKYQGNSEFVATKIFPGFFNQYLYRNSKIIKNANLPFDFDTFHKIDASLKSIGYSLDKLSKLSVDNVFELSQSKEWKEWRNYIVGNEIPLNFFDICNLLDNYYDKKIELINFDNEDMSLVKATKWLPSGQTLVGYVVDNGVKNYELDLNQMTISIKETTIKLTRWQTQILAYLNKFPEGVRKSEIYQLEREFSILSMSNNREIHPEWEPDYLSDVERKKSQVTRIDTQKSRLNEKLKPIELQVIVSEKGVWKASHKATITVVGTGWSFPNPLVDTPSLPPCKLSPQLTETWNIFYENINSFIRASFISSGLNKEYSQKQISDIVYRLSKKLSSTSYSIDRSRKGEYMLVHNRD